MTSCGSEAAGLWGVANACCYSNRVPSGHRVLLCLLGRHPLSFSPLTLLRMANASASPGPLGHTHMSPMCHPCASTWRLKLMCIVISPPTWAPLGAKFGNPKSTFLPIQPGMLGNNQKILSKPESPSTQAFCDVSRQEPPTQPPADRPLTRSGSPPQTHTPLMLDPTNSGIPTGAVDHGCGWCKLHLGPSYGTNPILYVTQFLPGGVFWGKCPTRPSSY